MHGFNGEWLWPVIQWLGLSGSATGFQTPLLNKADYLYLGEVFLGSEMQQLWVVWDTGFGGNFVRTTDCAACDGSKFSISQSSTFEYRSPTYLIGESYREIGSLLYGKQAYDTVCATADAASCIDSLLFVSIQQTSSLQVYEDGVFGLWSGNKASRNKNEYMLVR